MSKKLKVGIYMPTLRNPAGKKGGVEATVHRLAQALADRGVVDVTCITGSDRIADARYAYAPLFPKLHNSRMASLLLAPLALNFVDFGRYDVLHFHGNDWFFLGLGRPTTVRTFHGSALREAHAATSWKRRALMFALTPLEYLSAALRTTTVAIGDDTRKLFRCGATIGNGVDLSLFQPRAKTAFPSICYIGLWEGRKRGRFIYDRFIDQVLPRVPDAKLYMIVDRCPDHPSVVPLTGATDQGVADVLARAWVFAYPSTYEGFGIPYVEALASGTAIVSSANPGAQDILASGRYGMIVDDAAFGASIVELLEQANLRDRFAEQGIDRAGSYAIDRIAAEYEQVYADAVRG